MPTIKLTGNFVICLGLCLALFCLTALEETLFPRLSLEPAKVMSGEFWRLITANLVHFGWVHTLMNAAALLLCTLAFFSDLPLKKFLFLLLWCCLAVGLGIYYLNPEYQPYAGLSGALHGLIVAGLLFTTAYPRWVRIAAILLVAGKLLQENSPGYEATDLQQLIPAAVAVESHLYGAIAGLVYALGDWLINNVKRKK